MTDHRSTPLPSGGSVCNGVLSPDLVFITLKMGAGVVALHMSAADAVAMAGALLIHARPPQPAMQESA